MLEAERACHAAAAGFERLGLQAGALQNVSLGSPLQHRFLMAMDVDDGFALEARRDIMRRLTQEFAQEFDLRGKPLVLFESMRSSALVHVHVPRSSRAFEQSFP